jgi:aromatic-L-amino-acid decarboxylase
MAGLGRESYRPVPTDNNLALDPGALKEMVEADLARGHQPCAVVATVGTTSTTARDPVEETARVTGPHRLWLHVDAALAGAAALLPEKRHLFTGLERADSYAFNPHQWLFTTLGCSLFFTSEPQSLIRTFQGGPEPFKAGLGPAGSASTWGVSPARRFGALKLWFVIRSFGLEGLQEKLRDHLAWARELAGWVEAAEDFDLLAPVPLQTVCFRFQPKGLTRPDQVDRLNERLMELLNTSGRIYLALARIRNRTAIRFSIGTARSTFEDVRRGWEFIKETARGLSGG